MGSPSPRPRAHLFRVAGTVVRRWETTVLAATSEEATLKAETMANMGDVEWVGDGEAIGTHVDSETFGEA